MKKPTTTRKKKLGDKVEDLTTATGIKKLLEYLNGGKECEGCKKRKEYLNSLSTRFRKKPLDLTVEEYNYLSIFMELKETRVKASDVDRVSRIHSRVFRKKFAGITNCSPCFVQYIEDLKELMKTYKTK